MSIMCCDCVFMLLSSDCTNEDWNIQDKLYTNNLIQLVNFRSLNLPTKSLCMMNERLRNCDLSFFFSASQKPLALLSLIHLL